MTRGTSRVAYQRRARAARPADAPTALRPPQVGARPDPADSAQRYCKSIYAGCSVIANATCRPCERIARGRSTVEREMRRKERSDG